ncbi:MAG: ATP-binding protein [Bacteroidaceae bacterium]|nr:ATP-binding protein [Bacteroidaceae bacterium]
MTLDSLIAQGEHQQQDFKYVISSVSKIAHSLSAFANTDGGRLLVGVRDNGRIAGVQSDEEIYMIDAAAKSFCLPAVECQMQTTVQEGRSVLICTVEASSQRPVLAREEDGSQRAYVRVADQNIVASPVHLELWRQQQSSRESILHESDRQWLPLFQQAAGGITLNRFCRLSRLPRRRAIRLVAQLLRFDLLQMGYDGQKWKVHSA